jgi:hypothetical protein
VQPWWACLVLGLVGVVYFLVFDVIAGDSDSEPMTGLAIVAQVWDDAWFAIGRSLGDLLREFARLRLAHVRPHPDVWIGAGTAIMLLAPLALRSRPSPRSRALLVLVSACMAFVAAFTTWGFLRFGHRGDPGPAYWIWLAAAALVCASPWLRRRDQFTMLAAWNERPDVPDDDLPELQHLPVGFAGLVEQTRALRVSLDVLTGLDSDTRQLLWEWCQRVDTCDADRAALLTELGLSSEPIRTVTAGAAGSRPDAMFVIDAALARFERTLLEYRSYAFR